MRRLVVAAVVFALAGCSASVPPPVHLSPATQASSCSPGHLEQPVLAAYPSGRAEPTVSNVTISHVAAHSFDVDFDLTASGSMVASVSPMKANGGDQLYFFGPVLDHAGHQCIRISGLDAGTEYTVVVYAWIKGPSGLWDVAKSGATATTPS